MKNPFITMPDDLVLGRRHQRRKDWPPRASTRPGMATLYANGGYLWVQERADTRRPMLYAGQAAAKLQFVPEVGSDRSAPATTASRTWQGYDVIDWEKKNNAYGNSTKDGTVSGQHDQQGVEARSSPRCVYFAQLDLWVAGTAAGLLRARADQPGRGRLRPGAHVRRHARQGQEPEDLGTRLQLRRAGEGRHARASSRTPTAGAAARTARATSLRQVPDHEEPAGWA